MRFRAICGTRATCRCTVTSVSLFLIACRQLPGFQPSGTRCDPFGTVIMPFGLTIGTERATALQNSIQDELTKREYSADAGKFFHIHQTLCALNGTKQTRSWLNISLS
jgi:hypothetical protein